MFSAETIAIMTSEKVENSQAHAALDHQAQEASERLKLALDYGQS